MEIIIYGAPNCPYCVSAKNLAEELKTKLGTVEYKYIDIVEAGISREQLVEIVGKPVRTIPQIFVDKNHIGGFSDFDEFVQKQNLLR